MNFHIKVETVWSLYEFMDSFHYEIYSKKPYFLTFGKQYILSLDLKFNNRLFNGSHYEYRIDTFENTKELITELKDEMTNHAPDANFEYTIKKEEILESSY